MGGRYTVVEEAWQCWEVAMWEIGRGWCPGWREARHQGTGKLEGG